MLRALILCWHFVIIAILGHIKSILAFLLEISRSLNRQLYAAYSPTAWRLQRVADFLCSPGSAGQPFFPLAVIFMLDISSFYAQRRKCERSSKSLHFVTLYRLCFWFGPVANHWSAIYPFEKSSQLIWETLIINQLILNQLQTSGYSSIATLWTI